MSVFGGRAHGLRLERMKGSPRWVNGVFHNTHAAAPGLKKGTALPTMREYFFGGERRVPRFELPVVDPRARWARSVDGGLRATWLGHSTVLLELDGVRVLTDPVWSDRASPVTFAGPKRFHRAPAPVEALAELDAVVVSHDHYDHLDQATVVAIAKTRRTVPFVTSLGVGAHLEAWGVPAERIVELDWWESYEVRGLRLTAAPSQHFSGRGPGGRNVTAWSSFAMRSDRHAVFFSGDTGLTAEYADIASRLGPFDLVMLEVGAYHPAWGDIHLGPENALAALEMLGGGALLPVHWGTFNLGMHAWDDPPDTLLRLASARDTALWMPRIGAPFDLRHEPLVDPWWQGLDDADQRAEASRAISAPLKARE